MSTATQNQGFTAERVVNHEVAAATTSTAAIVIAQPCQVTGVAP